MKKILIVVHSNTFFVELFRLVKFLKNSEVYFPEVYFASSYPTWVDDAKKCTALGVSCLDSSGDYVFLGNELSTSDSLLNENKKKKFQNIRTIYGKLKRIATKFMDDHLGLVNIAGEYLYFRNKFKLADMILERENPTLLVLGGDMVGYDTSVFIAVAHEISIPVVILPSTMSNGLEQAEAYYYDSKYRVEGFINNWAAKMYPKWVFEHRGHKLLRVPGERVFIMEYLNLAPPLPWIFNSGNADAIVVESQQMKKYYQECGIPDGQLKLIGSLADDEMFSMLAERDANRKKLCEELKTSVEKPILLFALPPDFLYLIGGRPECDFSEYQELVRFWTQSITAHAGGYSVVACLHPSVRYEDLKYIEDWGVRIARKGTAELIPLCDIYVASVSSTIRWAIACGKPVLNYDVYRYRYTDYMDVKGVITVEEKTDFVEQLHRLTTDDEYFSKISFYQHEEAPRWGNFDGRAGERLMQLFASMIDIYAKE